MGDEEEAYKVGTSRLTSGLVLLPPQFAGQRSVSKSGHCGLTRQNWGAVSQISRHCAGGKARLAQLEMACANAG